MNQSQSKTTEKRIDTKNVPEKYLPTYIYLLFIVLSGTVDMRKNCLPLVDKNCLATS